MSKKSDFEKLVRLTVEETVANIERLKNEPPGKPKGKAKGKGKAKKEKGFWSRLLDDDEPEPKEEEEEESDEDSDDEDDS